VYRSVYRTWKIRPFPTHNRGKTKGERFVSPKRPKPPCIYCGILPGKTRDHVPPKALFAHPRPNDLITVPCCTQCREGQSRDDEYFVHILSMREGTGESPSVRAARDAALRSLMKPAKAGFARSLLRSVSEVEAYSTSGIYLGQRLSYNVELNRLTNVIDRTTRGLYYHEYGQRLPDGHRCQVYALAGFHTPPKDIVAILRKLWRHAISGRRRDFGDDVFSYWTRPIDGPEGGTSWAYLVYGFVPFYAFTGPMPDDSE
jgi:hypothetical protein